MEMEEECYLRHDVFITFGLTENAIQCGEAMEASTMSVTFLFIFEGMTQYRNETYLESL
jgi:hypothetical protein